MLLLVIMVGIPLLLRRRLFGNPVFELLLLLLFFRVERGAGGQHTPCFSPSRAATTAAFATGAGAVPAALFSFGGKSTTPPAVNTTTTPNASKKVFDVSA